MNEGGAGGLLPGARPRTLAGRGRPLAGSGRRETDHERTAGPAGRRGGDRQARLGADRRRGGPGRQGRRQDGRRGRGRRRRDAEVRGGPAGGARAADRVEDRARLGLQQAGDPPARGAAARRVPALAARAALDARGLVPVLRGGGEGLARAGPARGPWRRPGRAEGRGARRRPPGGEPRQGRDQDRLHPVGRDHDHLARGHRGRGGVGRAARSSRSWRSRSRSWSTGRWRCS